FLRLCSRAPRIEITRASGRGRFLSNSSFIRRLIGAHAAPLFDAKTQGQTTKVMRATSFASQTGPQCARQNELRRGHTFPPKALQIRVSNARTKREQSSGLRRVIQRPASCCGKAQSGTPSEGASA